MNSKERFEFMKKNFPDFFKLKAEEIIKNLVNFLINSLYIPMKGGIMKEVDIKRLKHFKINKNEPINWGNLKCKEVQKINNNIFFVKVKEAGESACRTFCYYIEDYLESYGWECVVETEW